MSAMQGDENTAECRNCQARNDAERKFCRECGSPLYGPCPECAETIGLSEKFCGGCGFQVGETFHQRMQAAQAMLHEGAALRGAAQYKQAEMLLRRLAADVDPLLHGLRRRAEQELQQCDIELRVAEGRRDELLVAAQSAIEQADFDRAVALLEQIPEGVGTDEIKSTLQRATAHRDEAEQLVRTIRDALAAKRYDGLLPSVERLLALKPRHEQARGIVEKLRVLEHRGQGQLRDRNHELAKRQLSDCGYDEAVALLEAIQPEVRTPDVVKTLDLAREVAWLSRQLRSALFLTETLLRLGERLLTLQPADASAAKLVKQMHQRRGASSVAGFAVPIRPFPAHPVAGYPVEMAAPWKCIQLADSIQPVLGTRFEQFHVAAGLALEGLGKVALAPKFSLDSAGKLWRRLSRAVRKRDASVAWGVDLGACSIKLIRLRLRDKEQVVADVAEQFTHERPLNQPGTDVAATVKNTWQRLIAKCDLSDGRMCVNIAGQSLLSRSFKLPPVESKKIPDLMKFEIPRQIPVPVDQVAWDFHVFAGEDPTNRYDREAALFAVRKAALRDRFALLESLDLRPDVLQADCLAIYSLLAFDGALPTARASEAAEEDVTMFLDIGGEATNVVIGHSRSIWTRLMPIGGNDFTKAIIKELKLTQVEAEKQKRQPFCAPSAYALDKVLQPAFHAFAEEIHRTITFYRSHQRRRNVNRIVLLGGGARLHGLLESLCLGR